MMTRRKSSAKPLRWLLLWQTLDTLLATNAVMTFTTTSGPATAPRFYRAITCP